MMGMYFQTGTIMSNILFEGWNTETWKGVLVAAFITCIMTGIFEGLKVLRAYVGMKRAHNPVTFDGQRSSSIGGEVNSSQADLLSSLRIPMHDVQHIRHRKIILFSLESLLYMFNFFYAYILMLLVMTYSVWLLIAVLVGSGVGYYFINPVGQCLAIKYVTQTAKPSARRCCSGSETQMQEGYLPEEEPIMAEIT